MDSNKPLGSDGMSEPRFERVLFLARVKASHDKTGELHRMIDRVLEDQWLGRELMARKIEDVIRAWEYQQRDVAGYCSQPEGLKSAAARELDAQMQQQAARFKHWHGR